jgi:CheY-like chemotaxis protein
VPQTLLLADDSVTIQRVIELTFADEDVRVVAVSDGDQAIARLNSDPPDVVLADVGMPGRSGYEVAEFIKRSPALAHIPVLLLTGAFEPIDEARAAAAGCDGVLAKPFEPQMVISRVRDLLARPAQPSGETREAALGSVPAGTVAAGATAPTQPAVSASPAEASSASAPSPPGASPLGDATVDDYFDRLDAAFASLNERAGAPTRTGAWPRPQPEPPASQVTSPPPAPAIDVPPLPEAFSTLLRTEQAGTTEARPSWPVRTPAGLSEEDVQRIADRVLARMSDRIVRETVTRLVSDVTERLIKEEIQKIKDQVK